MGDDHWHTLRAKRDLGVLCRDLEQFEEAERLLTEALEGRAKKKGRDDTNALRFMCELSVWYTRQMEFEEAEHFLLEALGGLRKNLGDQDKNTLLAGQYLIELYDAWEKPDQVEYWRAKLPQTENTTDKVNGP